MRKQLLAIMLAIGSTMTAWGQNITFADPNVEAICVENWDSNHDGKLSMSEAAAVSELGEVFKENTEITSFNELRYFTGLTEIGGDAFLDCTGLTSVTIPNSVTSIDGNPFRKCSNLASIIVEEGNTNYDSRDNCNAIIETSTNKLISGCKNTIIPEGITAIGGWSFSFCSELASINIPNSVTRIEMAAFENCYSLTSVTIPNSVTIIEGYAFSYCNNLPSVTIPNSVTSIGVMAFNNCHSFTSIAIPNSVTSIGGEAFIKCSHLTEVLSMIREPFAISTDCWEEVPTDDIPLYVPKGTKDMYEATEGWNVFKNIIEFKKGDVNNDGYVNAADVRLLARYIVGLEPSLHNKAAAYVNDDNKIDIADLVKLIELVK